MITPSFGLTATERVLPKLALDFTTASLDSRVTFTRTTDATHPATYVNSSGYITQATNNQPRFDYNPTTLVCKGLLIEEARTNLFVQSEDFTSGSYTKSVGATANTAVAPDNNTTADTVYELASTTNFYIGQSVSFNSGTSYTMSIFAKKADGATSPDIIQMTYPSAVFGSTQYANFNINTGTVLTTAGGASATITPVGNGWMRLTYTASATASASGLASPCVLTNNNNSLGRVPVYAGAVTSTVYIWGAQLEAGAFSTSYIPTTTAALIRNADVATITGTNFSDWWQASKGGVLVRARPGTVSGTRPWLQFDDNTADNTADNIIALRGNATNLELYIVDGGTPQAQIDAGTIAANTDYSMTAWWQTNDCKARLNNGAVVTDTSATIPTVTQARLGSDGTNYLNGHLASINYYDTFSGQIYTRRKNKAVFNLM
jgi:hypothetical protein